MEQKIIRHSNGCVSVSPELARQVESRALAFFRAQLVADACKPLANPGMIKERILADSRFSRHILTSLEIGSTMAVPTGDGIYTIDPASFKWLEAKFPIENEGRFCGFWHWIQRDFPPQNARPVHVPFEEALSDSGIRVEGVPLCSFSRALNYGSLSFVDYAILSQLAYQRHGEAYLASGAIRLGLGKGGQDAQDGLDAQGGQGNGIYAPFLFNILSFEFETPNGQKTMLEVHDAFIRDVMPQPNSFYVRSLEPRLGQLAGNGYELGAYFLGDDVLRLFWHLAGQERILDSDIDAAAMELLKKRGYHPASLMG